MKKTGRVFRNNLVVGLVLVAPLFITAYIVYFLTRIISQNWLTKLLTDYTFSLLPQALKDGTVRFVLSQIIAILLLVLALFLIGFFVRSFFGRRLYGLAERILISIPVINKIYIQVRHVSETIFSQRETMFQEVVLVEYPRKGVRSVAFVTSSVPKGFLHHFPSKPDHPEGLVALFVPTTPNPTSGMMIFVPRSDVIVLPISIAEAMKLVVSAGAVYPGDDSIDDRPTLLDKLEQWITRETDLAPVSLPEKDTEKPARKGRRKAE